MSTKQFRLEIILFKEFIKASGKKLKDQFHISHLSQIGYSKETPLYTVGKRRRVRP